MKCIVSANNKGGVSKTTITPSPVDIGQPIQYDIVLRNNGTATTPKLRLVDTLPTGFEWINTGAQLPVASIDGGSAATLSGALTVVNALGFTVSCKVRVLSQPFAAG